MSHPIDATSADPPPAEAAAKPTGRTLVEDAPAPDLPLARDRAGAARGMALLLIGGALFWGLVGAAIWFASR
ncbi:MAG: hypothetical protein ACXWKM_09305 [Phenylobacterium sp.]